MNRRLKQYKYIFFIYFVLVVLGIPWYWPVNNRDVLWGMPAWATIAIIISVIASLFTAFVLLFYRWPGESKSNNKNKTE